MEYWFKNPLLHYSISPILQFCSRLFHIADECLSLVNRNVRIADQRCQLVDDIAFGNPLVTPMPGHADLVNDLTFNGERAQPAGDERLGADGATRTRDLDPVKVRDLLLGGEFRADLDEKLGLQLGEPRVPAAHRARQVMLGQSIRRD